MKTKAPVKKLLLRALTLIVGLFILAGAAIAGYYTIKGYAMYKEAIAKTPIEGIKDSIAAGCDYVTVDELPQIYIDAVLSAEDRRFYTHHGIDYIAIARAVIKDIQAMSFAEGGSTITQQLAKNQLFSQKKHLERKFAEIFAARAIERAYTKDEIFEMYVNSIYFGSGYYGISAASHGYFGEAPIDMTDYEAVMLAGLPNAPSKYSPHNSIELATRRMTVVLQRMINHGKLTTAEADVIEAEAFIMGFEHFNLPAA